MSGEGAVPQSVPEMSNPQFMMGMIHQSLADLKATVEKMVTRHEFEATKRDVDKLGDAVREHEETDQDLHDKLDRRVDNLEKIKERVYGIAVGVGLVSGGVGAYIGTAIKTAVGH